MTVAELARQLLIDAPSDALCDPCLALACGATLTEMRQITKALLGQSTTFHQDATCASCHRVGRDRLSPHVSGWPGWMAAHL